MRTNNVDEIHGNGEFDTVGDLIDYLEILGRDRLLIVDLDGNTFPLTSKHVALWDENDAESPVAFFAPVD